MATYNKLVLPKSRFLQHGERVRCSVRIAHQIQSETNPNTNLIMGRAGLSWIGGVGHTDWLHKGLSQKTWTGSRVPRLRADIQMQIPAQDEPVKYFVKRKGWGSHQTVLRPVSCHPSHSLSKRLLLWSTKDKRGGGVAVWHKTQAFILDLVLQVSWSIYISCFSIYQKYRVGPVWPHFNCFEASLSKYLRYGGHSSTAEHPAN